MWLFVVLLIVFIMTINTPLWLRRFRLYSWKKSLNLQQHESVYNSLFHPVDGFAVSKLARKNQDAPEYVYGEIQFTSFIALISLTHPNQNTVFYDLGSGIGKAVIACAMVFSVKKSIGIELFSMLHQVAFETHQHLANHPDYARSINQIAFHHADFLNKEIADATLIFINSTAFFGETWINISKKLEETKIDTIIITTSKVVKSKLFTILQTTSVDMSWGRVSAYIQRRVA